MRGPFELSPPPWRSARRRSPPGAGRSPSRPRPETPQQFSLALDFYVNPDHAGIFEAIDNGYSSDAGLDVQPQTPSDPSAPIKEVAAGRVDLAISYEPEVLLAHDQGLPVKAVAALVPTPLTSLIWLKDSGIQGVKDLQGKTIATAGIPYQEAYLKTILEREGLSTSDVNTVDVQQGLLPAILSGKAQAMLGGFLNVEGVDLKLQGKDPTVIPVDELGIPTYNELVLVANSDTLDSKTRGHPPLPRRPRARDQGRRRRSGRRDQGHPRRRQRPRPEDHRGRGQKDPAAPVPRRAPSTLRLHGPAQWKKFAQFFADNGVIKALPSTDDLLTNDLPADERGAVGRSGRHPQRRALRDRLVVGDEHEVPREAADTARRERRTPPPPRSWRAGPGPARWPTSLM